LVVHNQTESTYTIDDGVTIQPGLKTYVGINRQFTNKLDKPYSDCLKHLTVLKDNHYSSQLVSYFKQLNVTYYDQSFCYKLCYQDKLINNCGCADIKTVTLNGTLFCASDQELDCLNSFDEMFSLSDIKIFCEGACPQQCNSIEYDLKLITSGFPALNYLKLLQSSSAYFSMFPQSVTDAELMDFSRGGFLKVIVNYDNPYYTTIDENPAMDSTSLFGFLGGQLGEFISDMINFFFLIIF
jgi:hypothetical protein